MNPLVDHVTRDNRVCSICFVYTELEINYYYYYNLSLNMGVDDNPLYNDFACLEDQKAKGQKEGNVARLWWFTYYRITKDEMWYICLTKFAFTILQPSYFQISTFITNDSPAFLLSPITLKVSISSLL